MPDDAGDTHQSDEEDYGEILKEDFVHEDADLLVVAGTVPGNKISPWHTFPHGIVRSKMMAIMLSLQTSSQRQQFIDLYASCPIQQIRLQLSHRISRFNTI